MDSSCGRIRNRIRVAPVMVEPPRLAGTSLTYRNGMPSAPTRLRRTRCQRRLSLAVGSRARLSRRAASGAPPIDGADHVIAVARAAESTTRRALTVTHGTGVGANRWAFELVRERDGGAIGLGLVGSMRLVHRSQRVRVGSSMRFIGLLILFGSGSVLAACSDGNHPQCESIFDCPHGAACVNGTCQSTSAGMDFGTGAPTAR